MPSSFSSAVDGIAEEVVPDDVAREQPVGLRGEDRRVVRRLRRRGRRERRRRAPATPLTRSCSASIDLLVLVAERAGRVQSAAAAATFWRSCSAIPASFVVRPVAFAPGVVSAFATAAPSSSELCAIVADLRHVVLVRGRASTSPRTTGAASPKKTSTATTIASSASRRSSGVKPRGGPRRAARPGAAAAAARQRGRGSAVSLLGGGRLVLEEVEVDVVVAGVHAQAESTAFVRSGEGIVLAAP